MKNDYWKAVAAIDANIFRELKGFDASFRGACEEDGELGGRLTQNGHLILAVPDAVGRHANSLSVIHLVRNDWRKGLISMRNHFRFNGNISDNRHATRRDIVAVALAADVILLGLGAILLPGLRGVLGAAALPTVLAYLICRADLIRTFASQGLFFVTRAVGLMFVIDLTRLICFVAGFGDESVDVDWRA